MPRLDAARLEALQVDLLHLVGRRLEDHLELVVLEEPVGVLAEPPVVGPARRLDVGDVPVARAEDAQECLGVRGASPDLQVQGLLDEAPAGGPEVGELEDQVLESHALPIVLCEGRPTWANTPFNHRTRAVRTRQAPSPT